MKNSNMLIFGYERVSTEGQLDNYSIEEQTSRLKSYCAAKGWTLVKIYTDGGYSGGNMDRPALKQMLSDLKSNHIDAVLVYKLDRLSRSQKDTLTLIEDEFLANDIDFISINENFDTSTPFGRAMIGILSVFAQLEKDQITERFTMGRIGRGKAGYFHGGGNAPTGYDYIDGKLIINEYEALQVEEAYELFLNGKSINAIEKYLSKTYRTKWTATKVRNVLKNSIYTGKVKFLKQQYDGAHDAIISEDMYGSVQTILSSSERENMKTTAQKSPFRAGYLLSGMLFCAACGAKYSANHGYYKCYSRSKSSKQFIKDPNCKNDNWEIEKLDTLVSGQIDQAITNRALIDQIVQASEKGKSRHIDKSKLQKECSNLDRQIEKLIELYQVENIPMSSITSRINDLSNQKKELEKLILSPDKVPAKILFLSAIENYKNGFHNGDIDKKRSLLSAIIEKVILDGETISLTWRI